MPKMTMSNASVVKKAQRKSAPKTKTGCKTCKIRKLKCGEEKPDCLRCIRFGVQCDGYGPLSTISKPATIKNHILLPKEPEKLLPEPSLILFTTEQDHRYFDIFCSKTAFEIFPCFGTGTLRRMLLQASVSIPSIRHAAVALGALDLTAESLGDLRNLSLDDLKGSPHAHHEAALRQYATAIKEMREAAMSGTQDLRTTLLTCLVILCFEAWNGNQDLAVRQIQTGLKLIQASREDIVLKRVLPHTVDPSRGFKTEENELIQTFSRLDVQAISFAPESTPERYNTILNSEKTLLDNIPRSFLAVNEAQEYHGAIMRQAMRFIATQVPLPKPPPPKLAFPINGWWGMQDPKIVAIQQTIMRYISNWTTAFQPLWNKLNLASADNQALLLASMLKLHIFACAIALITVCSTDEENFDAYTSTFEEMVKLATSTLELLNRNSSTQPKFSFDSHVVIPLHMVMHKCREKSIRRKAMELLLKNPRREGVWDSVLGARIGEWAMFVEEEFCDDEEGWVPGWARIHGVMFERDGERRSVILSCEQRVGLESEEVVVRRKVITW